MIPHGPPTRFELEPDGTVVLPPTHPLARGGRYSAAALLELAAQLAGRAAEAAPGHRGMLVEVLACVFEAPALPAGTRLRPEVARERGMGPLQRFHVRLPGVLDTRLTLRVAP